MQINNEFAKFQINGRTKAERQPEEGWKTVGRRLENNRTKAEKQPDEGWKATGRRLEGFGDSQTKIKVEQRDVRRLCRRSRWSYLQLTGVIYCREALPTGKKLRAAVASDRPAVAPDSR